MGDVSAVSSSGNILLPQQDEVGGLSEALKKAVEKHKTEYSGDKKDRDYGDAFVMHKETALPVLLAAWRHGAPAKSEHHNGNVSGLHHNGKGELRIAEKLLKVTAEKSVGLISTEAKVDKSAALLSSKNRPLESVSGKKLSADLKAVESVSEVTDNATGISDDNIKALPGDNKAIAGEGVRKRARRWRGMSHLPEWPQPIPVSLTIKIIKRLKMFLSFRCNQPLSPILAN